MCSGWFVICTYFMGLILLLFWFSISRACAEGSIVEGQTDSLDLIQIGMDGSCTQHHNMWSDRNICTVALVAFMSLAWHEAWLSRSLDNLHLTVSCSWTPLAPHHITEHSTCLSLNAAVTWTWIQQGKKLAKEVWSDSISLVSLSKEMVDSWLLRLTYCFGVDHLK